MRVWPSEQVNPTIQREERINRLTVHLVLATVVAAIVAQWLRFCFDGDKLNGGGGGENGRLVAVAASLYAHFSSLLN